MSDIGRNDQCFCQSGKKYKQCCGADIPIHPDSVIGKLIKAYRKVDQLLQANAKLNEIVPCQEKCSECCYISPFRITQQEFLLIQLALTKLEPTVARNIIQTNEPICQKIFNHYPSTAETIKYKRQNKSEYYHSRLLVSAIESNIPHEKCPFLIDDLCQVYEYRPYICRIHGKGQITNPTGCSKIDKLDIFHLQTKIPSELDPDRATGVYGIGLSLFAWVHRRKDDISISSNEKEFFFIKPLT